MDDTTRLVLVGAGAAGPAGGSAPGDARGRDRLVCGRLVEDLVDQADAGRLEPTDAHQAGCRYCRQALRDAAVSGQALELLRTDRSPVPAGLVDRVLRSVRSTRPPEGLLELPADGPSPVPGRVRVSRQLLADVARVAAAGQAGVTVTRAVASLVGADRRLRVSLSVLVDGRTPLPELAVGVRRAVRAAMSRAVSANEVDVELTALDVVPDS